MRELLRWVLVIGIIGFLEVRANAQAPVANFSANNTSSCNPLVVQFTDLSTNNPTSWSWNLGNSTTSIVQNPSTTYSTPGTYTVTLTVTNASGTSTKTITNYITILVSPTVNFTANDTIPTCGSKIVTFTNSTVLGTTGAGTYYWDFGDGSSSTTSNPVHTYSNPGTYSVSLVATNSGGCSRLFIKPSYITILPKPTTGFTATNNNSCTAPVTVSFSNSTTGATGYLWQFGDGDTSTLANPNHTYLSTGSFSVRLISTSAGGCKDTLLIPAYVNIGTLVAGFTPSTTSTCTNNGVVFTNTTTPGGGGSTWYFGDGSTSTQISPVHAYATAGTYTVKLVVHYNNCSDSVTHSVTVTTGPSSQFTASPVQGCAAPFTTNFTNNSTGATSFLWLFGDGGSLTSANPSHTYNSFGNYTVTLITTSSNGCHDTMVKPAYVVVQPTAVNIQGNTFLGCAPGSGTFTANVTSAFPVTSYNWNFGDGNTGTGATVSHTYSGSGTYILKVIVTNAAGCVDSGTATVIVGTKPVASFTSAPDTVCLGSIIHFISTSTGGLNYLWYYGDGSLPSGGSNPYYAYNVPGIFTVKLVVENNGCFDTIIKPNLITVMPPQANFLYTYPCNNRTQITFTNISVGGTSFTWNFGDGTSSTAANPGTHTYPGFGSYLVTLTATSSITGCTHSYTQALIIHNPSPIFFATDTSICNNKSTFFYVPDQTYASYHWDFGDGTTGLSYAITKLYTANGRYTIKLVATDSAGCKDSLTRINYIAVHSPSVSFTNSPAFGCGPLLVTFNDLSTVLSGYTITNRTWDFGDGTTLTTSATSLTHTYLNAGTYTVKLYESESGGCQDSLIKTSAIFVNKPVANFSSSDTLTCVNSPVSFQNLTSGRVPFTYSWNFGDGGISTNTNPVHTYPVTGHYNVRLIAIDSVGCRDTALKVAYIKVDTVHAAFTPSDTFAYCPPFTVNFANNSLNAVSYAWSFGNGNTTTLQNPSATYTAPGTFTIRLIATNANGCKDTAYRNIVVNTGPSGTLTYSPTSGCSPLTVTFTATSTGTTTTSITYDFANGVTQTTTATTLTYTYPSAGTFVPKIILANAGGCATSVVGGDTIKINKINVGFTVSPNPACTGLPVTFTDTSSATTTGVSVRAWTFGDGGTSSLANPTHSYASPGTYSVRLIGTTSNGCIDTAFRTVVVNQTPILVAANPTICAGQSVQLSVTGAANYLWSPATNLSSIVISNPVANPTATISYIVTGTSALGCSANDTVTVTVNPKPVLTLSPPITICSGSSVTLTATGANTYAWSPATGLSATSGASVTASPTTSTTYKVIGTTGLGCKDSLTSLITVTTKPVISVTPSQTICSGSAVSLTATGGTVYAWSPATGLSSVNTASTIASPTSTTTYKVVGTTAGCSDSALTTITVNPIPVINVGAPVAICLGASSVLTATGATTYTWSPATGLSATIGSTVTATPTVTTTYTVSGTLLGCTGTSTKLVTVNPLPNVTATRDTFICTGGSVTLIGFGASSFVWSPASGLSSTNTASTTASPSVTTNYVVTGTDANGCTDTGKVTVVVNSKPTISAGANTSICPGGSATLTATGGVSYVWSPGASLSCTACATTSASPSVTTTYLVTGTAANGCFDTSHVTVSINSSPVLSITGNNSICAGSSSVLTASGANSFSWSPATGLSCTACASPTANPSTTTTYTITGTSGVGCSSTTTYTVTVNPKPIVSAGSNVSICSGSTTSLTATGAATYAWSPSTSLSASTGTPVTASPTVTTIYKVVGTSLSGCQDSATVTVTVNPLPTVGAGSNVSICPGSSTVLGATGAATYSWSPSTGLSCTACAAPTASPTATTTYTVTGTSSLGCINTSTVTVSINSNPTISVSGNTSICVGGSTTLTAAGANTYSWSPATGLSATTGNVLTANPATTTTYTIVGTSGVGCNGTTTVTISVNPLPSISGGPDTSICSGGSVVLNASGGVSYTWSPTAGLSSSTSASPTANPGTTTTYTVTGTSALGCSASANVKVTVKSSPAISAGANTAVCPGGTVTLNGTGGATYVWSPAATLSCIACPTTIASPLTTTTYTLTGTAANGCSSTANVLVTVNPNPVITVSGVKSLCAGNSSTLTASGAASYSWSPSTGLSCNNCSVTTVNISSTTQYIITGTSAQGCIGKDTETITVHPLPVVTVDSPKTACYNTPIQLNAGGAMSYVWLPTSGLSCSGCSNPIATPSVTTTYKVIGTDGFGCIDSAKTTITILQLPIINAGPDINICKLNTVRLHVTGGISYLWSPVSSLSCGNCDTTFASPIVTTSYIVTGVATNGCTANDTVMVIINPQPQVNAGPDQTICYGSSAQLQASGASTYIWSPASSLSCNTCANPLATPGLTTTYLVRGTDINGCKDSDQVIISVIQRNPVTIDTGGDFCIGGSLQLIATGGDNYTWTPANTLSCANCPNPIATPLATTTYSVIIKQGTCFTDTLQTTVTIHPLPTISAGPDQNIILGNSAQLNASGTNISTYSWSPAQSLSCANCQNPVALPAVNTTYTVVVTSGFGCIATDSMKVNVRCDGLQLWLPNTFTPNADNHNDRFYPHGKGISNVTRFRIYDRWGELIFDRSNMPVNDRDAGWDGTYKNQQLKPDVFVWVISATCTNGEPLELKGDISLIR